MRRAAGVLAALVLAAVGMGAGFSGTPASMTGDAAVDRLVPGSKYSSHSFTDSEYLQPRLVTVKAAIAPCFSDGYDSFASFYVAVTESIRTGLGRFAGSTFVGVDLRGTAFVEFSNVGQAGYMTPAQLRSLDQKYYEIGSHGRGSESMGAYGFQSDRSRVTFGSVTGMSKNFLDLIVSSYVDSAAVWGIESPRSHGYTRWRQQLGMTDIWRKYGIYQAASLSQPVPYDQTSADGAEISAQQVNSDGLLPAIFKRPGKAVMNQGFHRIGEPFNDYDVGCRGSWDVTSGADSAGTTDNVKNWTDWAVQMGQMGIPIFHNIAAAGARSDSLDIEQDELYDLIYFWADRVQAGVLDVITFEQLVARMRGIRDGNQLPHYNFKRLSDLTYTSLISDSVTVPISMVPPMGSITFYGQGIDTMGTAAGDWKVVSADTITAAHAALGFGTDSLSYGLADTTGNVIVQQGTTAATDGLPLLVVTSGARARYMMFSIQILPLNDPGAVEWADDFHLSFKAGQFYEVWEDNVNGGEEAYASMKWLVGQRNTGDPSFASFSDQRVRMRPQFNPAFGDTTGLAGGTFNPSAYATAQAFLTLLQAPTLRPYIFHDKANDWDFPVMYGTNTNLFGAGAAGDIIVPDNVDGIREKGKVSTWHFYVPVNDQTDMIWANMSVERNGTTMSGNGEVAILNWEVFPIR